MEPWKTYIGDGNGCMFFFSQSFIDNGIINVNYGNALEVLVNTPGIEKPRIAERYKILSNDEENKKKLYSIIKNEVFQVDNAEFFFASRIFRNSTLTQSQAFDFVIQDNILGLLSHPDTLELTTVNGSTFLGYLL